MEIDFEKMGGLVPAVVQNTLTKEVLMLGYVNEASLAKTRETGYVTFFSRSKDRLWTKGETSGNHLRFVRARIDCDGDAVLIEAEPEGPVCHKGTSSCFGADEPTHVPRSLGFLGELEEVVERRRWAEPEVSYVRRLFDAGVPRMAQKVGEEGVETALAAVTQGDAGLLDEAADLVFHLTVLLQARGLRLTDVARVLEERHAAR